MNKLLYKILSRFVPPPSVYSCAWWSDNGNSGSFDGEIIGHQNCDQLENGIYWVRDIGTDKPYRRYLDFKTGQNKRV